ncbi:MAG: MATE family efflux transporter [Planctomycetes bacterium]|nr:MATE family efflux transporter [Planctomycetota bacterium]NOG54072.1 MATE family efflux transporter [Planctomycetota bacterium]
MSEGEATDRTPGKESAIPAVAESVAEPKSPLAELWLVAWPTILTMTSYTIMQFVDALMVSKVGPTEFTAQGNGGIFAFLPISFAMGLLSVVNTYVSQNLGAGTPERGPKYAWGALWLAVGVWLILIPYGIGLPLIFSRLGHEANIVPLETLYARVLVYGSILTMASRSLSHFFYGLHRPRIVFVATVIGNLTNVFANWVLIFGHLGVPELGLAGAAYGTVIGTAVELAIPLAIFLGPKMNAEFQTRRQWRLKAQVIRDLMAIGWPKSMQFGNEMICWSIFMAKIVGLFGTAHMTAGWIALRYMHLSFMPAVGISVAVTAVVGKYIGAGKPDIANQRAWLGMRLAVGYMGTCALLFIVFRHQLVDVFLSIQAATNATGADEPAPDPAAAAEQLALIREYGAKLLICAAVFQIFDAVAITLSGALSGAGDTIWPGVATIIASWVFIVGFGWSIAILFPELHSLGPWIGAAAFIISLGIAFFIRWQSGHWRSINLLNRTDDQASQTD